MLSDTQRRYLNRAVYDYVQAEGAPAQLLEKLGEVLQVGEDAGREAGDVAGDGADAQILAKKWNSIVRLQSKILDLEQRCEDLQRQVSAQPVSSVGEAGQGWVPGDTRSFAISAEAAVTALCLHPTLPVVFIGLDNGKLLRYDILNHEMPLQSVLAHIDTITSISVTSSASPFYLATASKDASCKLWELAADAELAHVRSFIGHEHTVSSCQFFERGTDRLLATCSRDLHVKIWDTSNGWCVKSFQPHTQWIRTLHVQGEYVVTGSNDATLRLTHWPSGNGLSMAVGHQFPIEKVLILSAGEGYLLPQYEPLGFQYVASASRDGTIKIWRVSLPKFIAHRPPRPNPVDTNFKLLVSLQGHTSWVRDLWQFQDKLFSCSDDGSIRCWKLHWPDIQSTSCVYTWDLSKTGFQNCLCMDGVNPETHSSRQILFSGSNDGTVNCFMK